MAVSKARRWPAGIVILVANLGLMQLANGQSPQPKVVVSGFVGADEIIFDLWPEGVAAGAVVLSPLAQDSRYSNIAARLPETARLGAINPELLRMARPDVVFVAPYMRADTRNLLQTVGVATTNLEPASDMARMLANIKTVAHKLGKGTTGEALAATVRRRLQRLQKNCQLAGKTFLNYSADNTLYGSGSSFDFVVTVVGGRNLAAGLGLRQWQKVAPEFIATLRPDYLVVATDLAVTPQALATGQGLGSGWRVLMAAAKPQVVAVPQASVLASTHYLLTATEQLCAGVAPK